MTPLTPMHQTEAACTPVTKSYGDGRRALDDLGRVKTGARGATLTAAMRRLASQIVPLPLGTTFEDVVRVSSWPPTTNGMPVLSVDDYPDTLLAQYIGGSQSHEGELHALAVNLARIADKAVREYRAASEYLSAFVQTPGIESIEGHTFLLRAIDHVENCIDAVARAEGFLSTSTFAAMAPPDQLETLKTVHEGVRAMRHSIQHADERIVKEQRVPEGEPLFPAITNDGIYFAGDHLFHGELAGTVIHVWLVAAAGIEAVASA